MGVVREILICGLTGSKDKSTYNFVRYCGLLLMEVILIYQHTCFVTARFSYFCQHTAVIKLPNFCQSEHVEK